MQPEPRVQPVPQGQPEPPVQPQLRMQPELHGCSNPQVRPVPVLETLLIIAVMRCG